MLSIVNDYCTFMIAMMIEPQYRDSTVSIVVHVIISETAYLIQMEDKWKEIEKIQALQMPLSQNWIEGMLNKQSSIEEEKNYNGKISHE